MSMEILNVGKYKRRKNEWGIEYVGPKRVPSVYGGHKNVELEELQNRKDNKQRFK